MDCDDLQTRNIPERSPKIIRVLRVLTKNCFGHYEYYIFPKSM
jgi:hypothetical protein